MLPAHGSLSRGHAPLVLLAGALRALGPPCSFRVGLQKCVVWKREARSWYQSCAAAPIGTGAFQEGAGASPGPCRACWVWLGQI